MKLIQIEIFDIQSAKGVLAFPADRIGVERSYRLLHALLRVEHHSTLGEHVRALRGAELLERLADDDLGVAKAIDRRGVDPVDAELERVVNGADGFVVVLRTPAREPTATAGRPGAEAHLGQVHVGAAELTSWKGRFHGVAVFACAKRTRIRPRLPRIGLRNHDFAASGLTAIADRRLSED